MGSSRPPAKEAASIPSRSVGNSLYAGGESDSGWVA